MDRWMDGWRSGAKILMGRCCILRDDRVMICMVWCCFFISL